MRRPTPRPLRAATVLVLALVLAPACGDLVVPPPPFQSALVELLAADAGPGDGFGWSVAVDGDTLLIGVHRRDAGGTDRGAVVVFERSAGAWTQTAELTADDGADFDRFGRAVALDGDTALVGAPFHDLGAGSEGAAYVFLRTAGVWSQVAKLVADDAAFGDRFGHAVALDGDRAIAGAPYASSVANQDGAAYVFERSGASWSQVAKLVADDAAADDAFGWAVGLDGGTAAVGAPYGGDGPNQGAAYVFEVAAGVWSQAARLVADDAEDGDGFGEALALEGDALLVGAPFADAAIGNEGAAYVFTPGGGGWTQSARLASPEPGADHVFGSAVAIRGDVAVVGAPQAKVAGVGIGAAHAFERSGGTWSVLATFRAPDPSFDDTFGHAVAFDGVHAVVGAPLVDGAIANEGAAYVIAR